MTREYKIPRADQIDCPACGTWICDTCGHKAHQVNRSLEQRCARCKGTTGTWRPVRHTLLRMVEAHADWYEQQKNIAAGTPLCHYCLAPAHPEHTPCCSAHLNMFGEERIRLCCRCYCSIHFVETGCGHERQEANRDLSISRPGESTDSENEILRGQPGASQAPLGIPGSGGSVHLPS